MRYEVKAVVRDSPERVYAWWTDYGPVGHKETVSHGFGSATREIVEREGDVVVLRESLLGARVLEHRVELHPSRRAFRETSDLFEAWWSFERCPEGTCVRREVEVKGGAEKMTPRALARWFAQKDLDHHVRQYERANRP